MQIYLKRHFLFHFFHNIISRWANCHVLQRKIWNLLKLFSICMREFAASFWANIINHAIIFSIQESTRHALQDIIIVFVDSQILVNKLLWLLAKMLWNPFYIGNRKKRTRSFTTISAFQAIGFLEFAIVQFLHYIIDIFGRLLFQLIKILFVFDMLIFGKLFKFV